MWKTEETHPELGDEIIVAYETAAGVTKKELVVITMDTLSLLLKSKRKYSWFAVPPVQKIGDRL